MRNQLRCSGIRTAASMFFLLALATPLLYANDLVICKVSDSGTPLQDQVFTFDVSGGNLSGTSRVSVAVGDCVTVATGQYLVYTITEEASNDSILSNVTASGFDNGKPVNGLVSPWSFPQRTVTVEVFTGNTTVTFTNTESIKGRFTGGGSIFTASGVRVTHGFELHCDPAQVPNNLEINFDQNRFHLSSLTTAFCFINSSGVAVIMGSGTGLYNGVAGYTIYFTFTDAGEPGTGDHALYLILGPGNTTILSTGGFLDHGNQQFHAAH
jgi:hypothetical protein